MSLDLNGWIRLTLSLMLAWIAGLTWGAEELTDLRRRLPVDFRHNRNFGKVIAADESTVAVSAEGAVVVYRRDFPGTGQWGQAAVLEAGEEAPQNFGAALAMSASGLFIGVPGSDDEAGAVYRFREEGMGPWQFRERLDQEPALSGARFGSVLAAAGEWLAVGAYRQKIGNAEQAGAVYLFRCLPGQPCTRVVRLQDPYPEAQERFGIALALSDQWLAVAADAKDVQQFKGQVIPVQGQSGQKFAIARGDAPFCGEDVGAVFLYRLANLMAGSSTPDAALAPADAECLQQFGSALAMEGERLAIGSPSKDVGDFLFAGVTYIYRLDQGQWREEVILASDHPTENAAFGSALALREGQLLVGVEGETAARFRSGAAYRIDTLDRQWHSADVLFLREGLPHDRFGAKVAIVGRNLWITAPGRRLGEGASGAVYLHDPDSALAASGEFDFNSGNLTLTAVTVEVSERRYRADLARVPGAGFQFTVTGIEILTETNAEMARYFPASGKVHIPSLEVIFEDGRRARFTVDLAQTPDQGELRFQVDGVR